MRKFGFSFSWKRALGLSAAKGKLSRLIGIPLTKSGRQRKAGRLIGDLVDTALIVGTQGKSQSVPNRETAGTATGSPWVPVMLANQFSHYELVDYKHGAKILVQYFPNINETNVNHDIPSYDEYKRPPFRPNLTVNGEIIEGKHVFAFHNSAKFFGPRPATTVVDTAAWWTHKIADPNEWHYPPKARVMISADDRQFELNVYSQFELRKDKPSDAEFYEVLITTLTYDMYTTLANAKNVTVQIGTASFNLDSEIIASYCDFVAYLKPTSRQR